MTAALPLELRYPHEAPPAPGEALAVAPGVLWLRMPLPFALDHINVWLLRDGAGWTLIDTGYGDETTRSLWERHFASTLGGAPIVHIIATHCHPDHVGNADWLARRFDCPVAMTHAEFVTAHAILGAEAAFAVEATLALFRQHGLADEHLGALARRGNSYRRGVPSLPLAFARLLDGDRLAIGARTWQIVEGHGHSPEHASLYDAADAVFVSGDMLLPRISTNVSIWPTEPDGDPLQRFFDSLARFESLSPEALVLPSHGLPFRGIPVRVAELRAHHAARLQELASAIEHLGRASAAEVVPVLFRRELDLQQRFFAMGEAIAHLNHLWHAGRLERSRDAAGCIRFAPRASLATNVT